MQLSLQSGCFTSKMLFFAWFIADRTFKTRGELFSHIDQALKCRNAKGVYTMEKELLKGFYFRCEETLSSNPKMDFEEFYRLVSVKFPRQFLKRIHDHGQRVRGIHIN